MLRCTPIEKATAVPVSLPVRWQPDRTQKPPPWPVPTLPVALGRGLRMLCPACGKTHMFNGYLRVIAECPNCHAPLGLARADDAPPYFTIIVVGHIVVPSMLILERTAAPPLWVQTALWLPMTLFLALALLRPIKGATVGLMLRLGILKSDPDE
jgi:uncharacterized protein (DUF983 family)